jgi:hypothetical protein
VCRRDSFFVERSRDLGEAAATRVLEANAVDDRLGQGRTSAGGTMLAGLPRWLDVLVEESV